MGGAILIMCAANLSPLISVGGESGCRVKSVPLTPLLVAVVTFCLALRVSSVLNRDVRQFGKKFMFDGDEETCWNSDQVDKDKTEGEGTGRAQSTVLGSSPSPYCGMLEGHAWERMKGGGNIFYMHSVWLRTQGSPQFVSVELSSAAFAEELHLCFQGGFASKECTLLGGENEHDLTNLLDFYPEDINSSQVSPCCMMCT